MHLFLEQDIDPTADPPPIRCTSTLGAFLLRLQRRRRIASSSGGVKINERVLRTKLVLFLLFLILFFGVPVALMGASHSLACWPWRQQLVPSSSV